MCLLIYSMTGEVKVRQTDRYADRQEVKASHPADFGSFRAQQIRWDYLSLIPCKVDSRFIDSCTACHSSGSPSHKINHEGKTRNPNKSFKKVEIYHYRKLRVKSKAAECVTLWSGHVGTLITNNKSNLGLFYLARILSPSPVSWSTAKLFASFRWSQIIESFQYGRCMKPKSPLHSDSYTFLRHTTTMHYVLMLETILPRHTSRGGDLRSLTVT